MLRHRNSHEAPPLAGPRRVRNPTLRPCHPARHAGTASPDSPSALSPFGLEHVRDLPARQHRLYRGGDREQLTRGVVPDEPRRVQILGAAQEPVDVDGDHDVEPPGVGVLEHPRPVRAGTTRFGGRDGGVLVLGDDPPAPKLGQVADLAVLGVDGLSVARAVLGDPHLGGYATRHESNVTGECCGSRSRYNSDDSLSCANVVTSTFAR